MLRQQEMMQLIHQFKYSGSSKACLHLLQPGKQNVLFNNVLLNSYFGHGSYATATYNSEAAKLGHPFRPSSIKWLFGPQWTSGALPCVTDGFCTLGSHSAVTMVSAETLLSVQTPSVQNVRAPEACWAQIDPLHLCVSLDRSPSVWKQPCASLVP